MLLAKKPFIISQEVIQYIENSLHISKKGVAIKVYPHPDDICEEPRLFLESMSYYDRPLLRHVDSNITFEIASDSGTISFYFWLPNFTLERRARSQISAFYPKCNITKPREYFGIDIKNGDFAAGAYLKLKRHCLFPVRMDFEVDALNAITAPLTSLRDGERAVLQFCMQPARIGLEYKAKKMAKQFRFEINSQGKKTLSRSLRDTTAADLIEKKIGEKKYSAAIRILGFGKDKSISNIVHEVAGAFNIFTSPVTGNGFKVRQVPGRRMPKFVATMLTREATQFHCNGKLSASELAPMVHLPAGKEVRTKGIEWSTAPY